MGMQMSQSIASLSKAMAQLQGELKNPINSKTVTVKSDRGTYSYNYAPLDEILDEAKPLMAKYGLSIMQWPTKSDKGEILIYTMLTHESGEWIIYDPLPMIAEKNTNQGAGSAISYGRRYCTAAILNISSQDDDDANGADGNNAKIENKQQHTAATQKNDNDNAGIASISDGQRKRLFAISGGNNELCLSVIKKYGYSSTKDIKVSDYNKISKEIETEASHGAI